MTEKAAAVLVELLENPSDRIDDLRALRVAWANDQDRQPSPTDGFDSDFSKWVQRESAHRRFWLASVEGTPVAMVNLLVFERMPTVGKAAGGWGYLCNMYVRPPKRNLGLGARLATEVLDYADGLGLERVVLSPTERSRPFYASLGFGPADNLLVRQRS